MHESSSTEGTPLLNYIQVGSTVQLLSLPDWSIHDLPQDAGGGKGTLMGEYAFTRDMPKKDEAIKEISWLTLKPGDSIGYHKHINNEDTYIIISGTGIFKDKDGKEVPVKAGDVTIVRKGESHGLTATGTEPLVFVDVIAEQ